MYLYCLFFLATCCTIAFRLLGEHDQVLPDVCIAQFIMPFPIPASFMCSSSALVPLMTFCIALGNTIVPSYGSHNAPEFPGLRMLRLLYEAC